ncbi:DNA-3-methyladenine glycosylase [Caviibacter abscessus]|uniref:DNA-3-methyladenine glycosylase n=1 Tax=Caviibacter abscessus TaxID=1766719 RepID=UPI000833C9FD|nr:DNA-3-methyladenine glycosylase [Caviibacter abscessus]
MDNFFSQDTISLAKNLLGKLLLIKTEGKLIGGYIVETEAYLGIKDKACHSYMAKRNKKNEAMYKKCGTIYIYIMHTHKMLNIVSCEENNPQAVLIRAIEPVYEIEIMEKNRGKKGILISNGPGKLTKAMGITDELNMKFMQENELFIDFENSKKPLKIDSSARIGIPDKGIWTKRKLRFFVYGNKYVSNMRCKELKTNTWLEH